MWLNYIIYVIMESTPLCYYLLQNLSEYALEHPSNETLIILSEAYVKLTKYSSSCVHPKEEVHFDPALISALGILILSRQREISH